MTDAVKEQGCWNVSGSSIEMYCDHLLGIQRWGIYNCSRCQCPGTSCGNYAKGRKGLWKLLKRGSANTITVGDPVYPEDCGSHRKTVRKLREDVEAEMNHLLGFGGKAYPKEPLHDEGSFFWRTGKRTKELINEYFI